MSGMTKRENLWLRRAALAVLAAVALAASPVSIARADGDPASDYLLANQVFVTSTSGSLSSSQRQLLKLVKSANAAGFQVRVAVIPGLLELGSVTELWRQPRTYAGFLGEELSLAYHGRLLVVMPNGFGFNWPGHSTVSEYRLLSHVPIRGGPDGLSLAAATAVRRLAATAHVTPAASGESVPTTASTGNRVLIIVVAGVLAVLIAVVLLLWRTGRWKAAVTALRRRAGLRRPWPLKAHLAIATTVTLAAIAVAVTVVASHAQNAASRSVVPPGIGLAPSTRARAVFTPPAFSWPAGRRRAPNFSLRDQSGGPVSLAAYRGHPVIVTFINPVCGVACRIESRVLDQAVQQMPIARRPEILAVSVDPHNDARANLLRDMTAWNLVPEWRWAVGSPAQLSAVWKRYEVSVKAEPQQARGIAASVSRNIAAYVVDRTGHERALFVWPFYPRDVTHVLGDVN